MASAASKAAMWHYQEVWRLVDVLYTFSHQAAPTPKRTSLSPDGSACAMEEEVGLEGDGEEATRWCAEGAFWRKNVTVWLQDEVKYDTRRAAQVPVFPTAPAHGDVDEFGGRLGRRR